MSGSYVIFLVLFIALISVFAYLGTREGFVRALNSLLRIAVPMLLSGVIVKIAQFIQNLNGSSFDLISYIIGGVGTVIFFLVLRSVIAKPEKGKKLGIFSYFFGFLVGLIQGWLIAGFFVLYLNRFGIVHISQIIPQQFFNAIVTPLERILFLDFIKI